MARKTLSNVDTAWLRMEDPTNMMMITGVMVFGAPMDFERLRATLGHGLLGYDRFRQRVCQPAFGRAYWADDPDLDLNYHIQRITLPPPGSQADLQELASLLASRQLDFSRPLWQMHLVEDYGDGCALICRLHHCIGDGLALVHVLLSLTTTQPDEPWPLPEPGTKRRSRRGRFARGRFSLGRLARPAGQATKALLGQCREMRAKPSRVGDLARMGGDGAVALGRLVLRWPDPKTIFKGPLDVPKRAAWSAPLPLQDVKAIGKGLGGTINDVLLTAMTGGLRRYLQIRDEPVDGLNIRAVVPVNLRRPGTEHELGNKFGLVFLSLPVGIADPVDRLQELKRRMDALKGSLEAPVAFGILNGIGMSPETIQDVVVNIFGTKGTAVMTNVIGPRERIYLAGAPLDSLMFWVPQSGRLGMGVSILSYAGRVWMGIITDEGLVPDPEVIVAELEAEYHELLKVARAEEPAPGPGAAATELSETLEALDEALEAEAAPSGLRDRCQALTKAGHRCKNRALPGSAYCGVHKKT
jgi:WS/DGAT/MGAT family acyltransferase